MPYSGDVKYRRYLYAQGYRAFIDSAETRVHLKWLVNVRGLTMTRIAQDTGIPYSRVRDIKTQWGGRYATVRREDAAAILAYVPTEAQVPSREGRILGASRILQGLAAKGIPSRIIAEYTEHCCARHTLDNWRMGNPRQVPEPESYNKLLRVGKLLEGKTPQELGVSDTTTRQVASRAKSNGYVPLAMWEWDTIHDPDASPEWTGHCGTAFGYQQHRRMEIPSCEPCNRARAEYRSKRRKARNDANKLG